jgi:hypothetical protein
MSNQTSKSQEGPQSGTPISDAIIDTFKTIKGDSKDENKNSKENKE